MKKLSKRAKSNALLHEREKIYAFSEAFDLIEKADKARFDETFEVSIHLGIDPRQTDQMVRGVVNLPHGTGKVVRVVVIAKDLKAKEAEEAGADEVGADELIQDIKAGKKLNFDVCITTPDMMGLVGRELAKQLGPKGLMPNPKLGTVTMDVAKAVRNAKFGQVEFRAEKAGIIHLGIGKLSFGYNKLLENLKSLTDALEKSRPAAAKGMYFVKAHLSSTMGIGVEFDINSFVKS